MRKSIPFMLVGLMVVVSTATVGVGLTAETHLVKFQVDGSMGRLQGLSYQFVNDGDSSQPVEAVPVEGYKFSGWIGDVTTNENPLRISTVGQDLQVTAQFEVDYDYEWWDNECLMPLSCVIRISTGGKSKGMMSLIGLGMLSDPRMNDLPLPESKVATEDYYFYRVGFVPASGVVDGNRKSKVTARLNKYTFAKMMYFLTEKTSWQGSGDMINSFKLKLAAGKGKATMKASIALKGKYSVKGMVALVEINGRQVAENVRRGGGRANFEVEAGKAYEIPTDGSALDVRVVLDDGKEVRESIIPTVERLIKSW